MKKIYLLFLLVLLPMVASADAVGIDGIYYNLDPEAKTAEVTKNPNGYYRGNVVIPATVTYENVVYNVTAIGDNAFEYCENLFSVTIPDGVTSIGEEAFLWCISLSSITIPNSVYKIGSRAFYKSAWFNYQPDGVVYAGKVAYCYKGDTPDNLVINFKEGTKGITERSFGYSCLTSVTIPSSMIYIGKEAFDECFHLESVHITDLAAWCNITFDGSYSNPLDCCGHLYMNGTEIKDLVIPDGVTSISSYAFFDCYSLTSVTIPNSVTRIDNYTFSGCRGLTSLTIPNSVTFIGYQAFYGCSNLKTIEIGNGIKTIDYYAFRSCNNLNDFFCYAEEVPETGEAFNYNNNATLHVPAGSLDAYKDVWPWNGFKEKVAITAKVKLNKTKATIEKTKTLTLKATVTPSDLLDKSVIWKSSNTKVATVTSKGKVTGVKAGTATITCTSKVSGAKATCAVTVGYVKLDQTEAVVKKGKTITLTPTVYPSSLEDKSVTWESSNTKVATVTSDGKVKGVKTGTATITCTSNATGLSRTCEVLVANLTLNNYELIIQKGKTATLKATVYPSSLEDKSVTWESSNTKVATVSSTGKVKGVKAGTATITCTSTATGLSRTCKVTVGYVKLDQTEVSVKKGKTVTLTATVYPSSLADKSVTWESSDKSIATVTSAGKVKGIKAGTATITCTSVATGLSTTCTVTVTATSSSRSVGGDDDDTTGIETIEEAPAPTGPFDVYDLSGRKVLNQTTSLDGLPDGIYIVNGKKILKKK